jgi:hypothetical protein
MSNMCRCRLPLPPRQTRPLATVPRRAHNRLPEALRCRSQAEWRLPYYALNQRQRGETATGSIVLLLRNDVFARNSIVTAGFAENAGRLVA